MCRPHGMWGWEKLGRVPAQVTCAAGITAVAQGWVQQEHGWGHIPDATAVAGPAAVQEAEPRDKAAMPWLPLPSAHPSLGPLLCAAPSGVAGMQSQWKLTQGSWW